jgi:hypothetical protein
VSRLLEGWIVRVANSRLGVPARAAARMLRERYYNAEVLRRPVNKIRPLGVRVDSSAPRRVNLLIPEINFANFYGGYIAKFNLARRLVEHGQNVRIITVDQCPYQPDEWRRHIGDYEGLGDIFERVDVACCFDRGQALAFHPDDSVIATTWWTAWIAADLIRHLNRDRFVYLIQEFEPFTFPMGSYFALARASYGFPHFACYSTRLLQEYFEQERIGFLHGSGANPDASMYFENAIIRYNPGEFESGRRDTGRRLLFYARPEAHASRNMFEIGYLALSAAIERGLFPPEWSFHGIGSPHGDIDLPAGRRLRMLGKFGLGEYRHRLLEYDLGLALMYTPHPSLLPLEMAAAGQVVVTSECLNKTAAKMAAISPNILAAPSTIEGVTATLTRAVSTVAERSAPLRQPAVAWANTWDDAFDAPRMERLLRWLRPL